MTEGRTRTLPSQLVGTALALDLFPLRDDLDDLEAVLRPEPLKALTRRLGDDGLAWARRDEVGEDGVERLERGRGEVGDAKRRQLERGREQREAGEVLGVKLHIGKQELVSASSEGGRATSRQV